MAAWVPVYVADLLFYAAANTSLFSLLIWNEYRLSYNAELEAEEQAKIKRSKASTELFDESDQALMLAGRALRSWRRGILPAFTVIYGIGAIVLLVMKWSAWKLEVPVSQLTNQLPAAACAGALAVCFFLVAAFFSGTSRQKGGMLLRGFSAWAYCSALICVVLLTVLFFTSKEMPHLDNLSNRIILVLFIGLALELSLNYLIDLYRPRFQQDEKSILESRLLALFTDSGSIAGNVAHALDYQFGIKVTESGFYHFLLKKFIPLLSIQLLALYLLSCFAVIENGHRGIHERLGTIDEKSELTPGIHMKLPWPFAKIHIFPADKVQAIEVGQKPKKNQGPEAPPEPGNEVVNVTEDVMLWSKKNHNEEGMEEINYIISREVDDKEKSAGTLASVSMITVIVPIHYKIKQKSPNGESPLYKYLFKHNNAKQTLKSLASHVVMSYLSSTDYFEFLGDNRQVAAEKLQELVQAEADRLDLGVEIVFLALESTHPPGDVSKSYDDVIAADYDKKSRVYDAEVRNDRDLSDAEIKSANTLGDAQAEIEVLAYELKPHHQEILDKAGVDSTKFKTVDIDGKKMTMVPRKLAVAIERSLRYKTQVDGFKAQPHLYALINYLDTIEETLTNTKKIIIDSSKASVNFRFDLKPKLTPDLEGLEIPEK